MVDRKDNMLLKKLNTEYNIVYTEDLIKNIKLPIKVKTDIYEFLIQKSICENADKFIGTKGSTVTNYIQYNRYINNKSYHMNFNNFVENKNGEYSWKNHSNGVFIAFSCFFPENIYKESM